MPGTESMTSEYLKNRLRDIGGARADDDSTEHSSESIDCSTWKTRPTGIYWYDAGRQDGSANVGVSQ